VPPSTDAASVRPPDSKLAWARVSLKSTLTSVSFLQQALGVGRVGGPPQGGVTGPVGRCDLAPRRSVVRGHADVVVVGRGDGPAAPDQLRGEIRRHVEISHRGGHDGQQVGSGAVGVAHLGEALGVGRGGCRLAGGQFGGVQGGGALLGTAGGQLGHTGACGHHPGHPFAGPHFGHQAAHFGGEHAGIGSGARAQRRGAAAVAQGADDDGAVGHGGAGTRRAAVDDEVGAAHADGSDGSVEPEAGLVDFGGGTGDRAGGTLLDAQAHFIGLRTGGVVVVGLHLEHAVRAHADRGVVDETQVDVPVGGCFDAIAHDNGGTALERFGAAVEVHHAGTADDEADLTDGRLAGVSPRRRCKGSQRHRGGHRPAHGERDRAQGWQRTGLCPGHGRSGAAGADGRGRAHRFSRERG
jgi:hypothetical protein